MGKPTSWIDVEKFDEFQKRVSSVLSAFEKEMGNSLDELRKQSVEHVKLQPIVDGMRWDRTTGKFEGTCERFPVDEVTLKKHDLGVELEAEKKVRVVHYFKPDLSFLKDLPASITVPEDIYRVPPSQRIPTVLRAGELWDRRVAELREVFRCSGIPLHMVTFYHIPQHGSVNLGMDGTKFDATDKVIVTENRSWKVVTEEVFLRDYYYKATDKRNCYLEIPVELEAEKTPLNYTVGVDLGNGEDKTSMTVMEGGKVVANHVVDLSTPKTVIEKIKDSVVEGSLAIERAKKRWEEVVEKEVITKVFTTEKLEYNTNIHLHAPFIYFLYYDMDYLEQRIVEVQLKTIKDFEERDKRIHPDLDEHGFKVEGRRITINWKQDDPIYYTAQIQSTKDEWITIIYQ